MVEICNLLSEKNPDLTNSSYLSYSAFGETAETFTIQTNWTY